MRNRDLSLDLLRILSAISVITIHVAGDYWSTVSIHSLEWQTFNFYDSMARFSVPAFVMISGVLLLDSSYKLTVSDLFKKKVLRFILMFLIWSLFYTFVFTPPHNLKELLVSCFSGATHLWFLKMIIGLYILIPILRKIVSDKQTARYFLIVYIVFSLFVYPLQGVNYFGIIYEQFIDNGYMYMPLGFTGYFIAGYYLKRMVTFKKNARVCIYLLAIVGFIITVLGTGAISNAKGTATESLYDYLTPNVAMMTLGVFTFFNYRMPKIKFSDKMRRQIIKLSNYTLGVYLIHPFYVFILNRFHINALSMNPIISVPFIVLIVFVLSLISAALLKKIPVVNKCIV